MVPRAKTDNLAPPADLVILLDNLPDSPEKWHNIPAKSIRKLDRCPYCEKRFREMIGSQSIRMHVTSCLRKINAERDKTAVSEEEYYIYECGNCNFGMNRKHKYCPGCGLEFDYTQAPQRNIKDEEKAEKEIEDEKTAEKAVEDESYAVTETKTEVLDE